MDELSDLVEDPDWDFVPPELRAADGQAVNVRGVQVLPDSIAADIAAAQAAAEAEDGPPPPDWPQHEHEGVSGTLCIFPEFFRPRDDDTRR